MSESCNESSCSSCNVEGCSSRKAEDFSVPANAKSHIQHVIGIVSGKGGVGKSLVTSELAVLLQKRGYKVGIWMRMLQDLRFRKYLVFMDRRSVPMMVLFHLRQKPELRLCL